MRFWFGVLLLLVCAGCGSGGGNFAAVTPVMADTRGTYRLSAATVVTTSAPAQGGTVGTVSSARYHSGTLRLSDTNYSKLIDNSGEPSSSGGYALGQSVNTILNTRDGSFTLTPDSGTALAGSYHVDPDVTLTLSYQPLQLADGTEIDRSETWVKVSDSPHYGE